MRICCPNRSRERTLATPPISDFFLASKNIFFSLNTYEMTHVWHVFRDIFMNTNILPTSTRKNLHYFYFVSSVTRCQHIQLSLSRLSHQYENVLWILEGHKLTFPLSVSLQRERLRNIERICNLLRKVSREGHQITSCLCCSGSECDQIQACNLNVHKMKWKKTLHLLMKMSNCLQMTPSFLYLILLNVLNMFLPHVSIIQPTLHIFIFTKCCSSTLCSVFPNHFLEMQGFCLTI